MGLIVKRAPGQAIMIGEDIFVMVKKVEGNQVSLLITAPEEININRLEKSGEFGGKNDAGK